MAYAPTERPFYDADSHIMELPNFLKAYADPGIRDEVPEVSYSASLVTDAGSRHHHGPGRQTQRRTCRCADRARR